MSSIAGRYILLARQCWNRPGKIPWRHRVIADPRRVRHLVRSALRPTAVPARLGGFSVSGWREAVKAVRPERMTHPPLVRRPGGGVETPPEQHGTPRPKEACGLAVARASRAAREGVWRTRRTCGKIRLRAGRGVPGPRPTPTAFQEASGPGRPATGVMQAHATPDHGASRQASRRTTRLNYTGGAAGVPSGLENRPVVRISTSTAPR